MKLYYGQKTFVERTLERWRWYLRLKSRNVKRAWVKADTIVWIGPESLMDNVPCDSCGNEKAIPCMFDNDTLYGFLCVDCASKEGFCAWCGNFSKANWELGLFDAPLCAECWTLKKFSERKKDNANSTSPNE